MRPTIDVVIVNWKSSSSLNGCLASVFYSAHDQHRLGRVVVVDNASDDDTPGVVSTFAGAVLIQNDSNRGFAAACNQGAAVCRADYLLFLNPDTYLDKNTIDNVVAVMTQPSNFHVGICGTKLYDDAGRLSLCCSRFPSTWSLLLEMTGMDRIGRSIFKSRHFTAGELTEDREVDQIIGACFMIRRELFERLNGFDERFFVYFEEVDLSLRARQCGYTAYFVSRTAAKHIGRVSSDQSKAQRLLYFVRSRLLYCQKHLGSLSFGVIFLFSITVEPAVRICSAAAGRSHSSLGEVLSGYGAVYAAMVRAGLRLCWSGRR